MIRCSLAVIAVLFLVFIFPRAINVFLPFIIAFFVAALLNPLVNKVNQKLKIPRRIIALVLDLLVFLLIASLIGWLVYAVINEAISFATGIQTNWSDIVARIDSLSDSFDWLKEKLPPQAVEILEGFEESIAVFIQNTSKNLLRSVMSATTTLTTKTGSFLTGFIMAILAAYFIIADYNRMSAGIKKHIGQRASNYISILKSAVINALGRYLKSQLLLALTAFLFMFAALGIYGQPYALLIALFLGIVDLLPIIGTIAILVPWGIIEIIVGSFSKGIFLIVIGVSFFLIRKVIEPKIVGSQTGLHPLAALMSIYVGLRLSGVWGAVLGPVVLMLIISIAKSGIFNSTVMDLKILAARISRVLNKRSGEKTES
ncbi:sporulation integral membrane protein YtvI [Brucepastera parasyntrophica]|uniref:sporulation integral membrane protein YtvI n=1 Tax=Brucepastera parasyntrophica TaxID=2880008 RepID=UPI00210A25C0|nr:sporulation integral membrane protein YtvI [Brucepastera parasyntrophica]ULQ60436.1 sporulation integral membrane protein YtvI [Brucepastera parasyntrophica]